MKKVISPNKKTKLTLTLPVVLVERVRNVVYWTPDLTLTTLVRSAIETRLKQMEKKRRFKPRRGRIRVGRPPKKK